MPPQLMALNPHERGNAVTDCTQQNIRILENGQVNIARKVLGKLLDRNMIATPEQNALKFSKQSSTGKFIAQEFVPPQFFY